MIEFLKISSLAIFDEIEITFGRGLNCITGETGAGKSLILGALTLLMGAKASKDLVRPGREKTSIEALFSVSGEELVLRREIFPSGSNRCYINGKLATVTNLAEVSSGLINIYGQHEYQDLLNPAQHMTILEELAGLDRDDLHDSYNALNRAHEHLAELKRQVQRYREEKEDILFSYNELKSVPIHESLEEELTSELELAYAAAELKRSAYLADDILYSGNTSVVDLIAQAQGHIAKITSIDHHLQGISISLKDIIARLEDISLELRDRIATYEYDPEMIETLESRLHCLQDLKKKHRRDEQGLIALKDDLEKRLEMTLDSDRMIQEADRVLEKARAAYAHKIQEYLAKRASYAETLCAGVNRNLLDLGMPGTRFAVDQRDPSHLEDGLFDSKGDVVSPNTLLKGEFLISTNVGHKQLPLARIASGGELSRIMLAIKVQQKASQDATLLFDEIDSGISGQTALMIANKLKELSGSAQAIVVTHLHQVASLAENHLVITKNVDKGNTISRVCNVRQMDRVMELARMMGGESPSHAVIEHAKELVEHNEDQAQSYH